MDVIEFIGFVNSLGRCEVIYNEETGYTVIPIPEDAILVTKDGNRENRCFFCERNKLRYITHNG